MFTEEERKRLNEALTDLRRSEEALEQIDRNIAGYQAQRKEAHALVVKHDGELAVVLNDLGLARGQEV